MCVGAIAAATLTSAPAEAGDVAQARVVSDNPANVTPNVLPDSVVTEPSVLALGHHADTIYAGGNFHSVEKADGSKTLTRHNIVAFDADTGAIRRFAPRVNGTVWAVQPYRKAIFLGGDFTTVNGVARHAIVKVNATTGAVVNAFATSFSSGSVSEIRMARGRLIVGGSIPGKLISLNPRTGHTTGYLKLAIEGTVASNAGATDVYRFAVSPNNRRLVAIGNFTSVAGHERWRAFMVNLRSRSAFLNRWSYAPLQHMCSADSIPSYLKDVDFSPDGSYFIFVASGFVPRSGGIGTDVCDAAARFETEVASPSQPTWINYTGGDTLHSTVATGAAVYVQGHQRWLDNPLGQNDAGPGAVSREGIGAIDPQTGKALSWNPGKTRGVGGKDMLATSAGLWVGSDGAYFNGEFRSRIAFCPL
ncbi:MAG: hypothetical protein ACJ72Y_03990 [Actinomycetes bacterium]